MKIKNSLFSLVSISSIGVIPLTFAISCSSSNSSESNILEQTIKLNNFLNTTNPTSISAKPSGVEIKSFVELSNWNNIDELLSDNFLGKYFQIADEFKNFLEENKIYSYLKKIVIQPNVGTRKLSIIFYLKSTIEDQNTVDKDVENALTNNFSFSNQIDVPSNHEITEFYSIDQLNNSWKTINDKKIELNTRKTELTTLIKRAFGIDNNNVNKIVSNYFDEENKYFDISKSTSTITLSITSSGKNEGYIFYKNVLNTYKYILNIRSNPLIQE